MASYFAKSRPREAWEPQDLTEKELRDLVVKVREAVYPGGVDDPHEEWGIDNLDRVIDALDQYHLRPVRRRATHHARSR